MKGPRRIFRADRRSGRDRPRAPAEACDVCGGPWSADGPEDGDVIRRLDRDIAPGRLPRVAMARACKDGRARAERDPEWGRAIADRLARPGEA
jgi:hypothetical protein